MSVGRINTRYILLYTLFGVVVGIRYAVDAWVLENFPAGREGGTHAFMALTMLGMLVGELLGGSLSDTTGRVFAVLTAATMFGVSAVLSASAIVVDNILLLLAGQVAFGLGLGIQHSSLDAWLCALMKAKYNREPTTGLMTGGWAAYIFGFLLAHVAAFPLLYRFQWDLPIRGEDDRPLLGIALYPDPYFLSIAAIAGIFLLRPFAVPPTDPVPGQAPAPGGLGRYVTLLRAGGLSFVSIVLVGAAVSFLIQHIDSYAGPDLIPAKTPFEMSYSLGLLQLFPFIAALAFSLTLEKSTRFRNLSAGPRNSVLAVAMLITLLGLALGYLVTINAGATILVVIAVGFAHSILNILPQVIKWAVLDFAVAGTEGAASSILGIAKRIPNAIFSLVLWGTGTSVVGQDLYALLMLFAAAAMLLVIVNEMLRRVQPAPNPESIA